MKWIIEDVDAAIIAMFEAVGTDAEAAAVQAYEDTDTLNNCTFWSMIEALTSGAVDAVSTQSGRILYTYTRSVQTAGAVRRTSWIIDRSGDMLPLSRIDIYDRGRRYAAPIYTAGIYTAVSC